MKKLLITGFEKFGDYEENISEIAATTIKKLGEYEVFWLVFPVCIFPKTGDDYGEMIIDCAQKINADAIISLGMSSEVDGIRIETTAINWVENYRYAKNAEQRRVIDETLVLKKKLEVNLDKWRLSKMWNIAALVEKLLLRKIVCEVSLSTDAGTYCSNALMFRTLRAMQRNNYSIPYLFLNVPCSEAAIKNIPDFDLKKDFMSLGKLENVMEVILENLN